MGTSLQVSSPAARVRVRALAVGAAVVASVAVWLVAVPVLRVRLALPDLQDPEGVMLMGLGPIVATSLAAGLIGWAVLSVLERLTRRGARLWVLVAVLTLLASFAGPFATTGMAMSARLSLAAMHIAVAAVLIPLLYRSAPSS